MRTKDPSYRALLELGTFLREGVRSLEKVPGESTDTEDVLEELLAGVQQQNPWFTRASSLHALKQWGESLQKRRLDVWLRNYPTPEGSPKRVGLVLAGNIPLVGFHDLLCVLVTGNSALVKCASNDQLLLPFLSGKLIQFEPELEARITYTQNKLENCDAIIATGSNNTSRYFAYYFSDMPHIIRKNRHGIAVLDGRESQAELEGLAADVFTYHGMGCRSVSKLFVPENYDFDPLFNAFYAYRDMTSHHKYANNYDYNKAVYLMSGSHMLDNGFLLLKEDASLGSPIGTLFYETYANRGQLESRLLEISDQIQCRVAGEWLPDSIAFGTAQLPGLSDYADGVDTVDFLLKRSSA